MREKAIEREKYRERNTERERERETDDYFFKTLTIGFI